MGRPAGFPPADTDFVIAEVLIFFKVNFSEFAAAVAVAAIAQNSVGFGREMAMPGACSDCVRMALSGEAFGSEGHAEKSQSQTNEEES